MTTRIKLILTATICALLTTACGAPKPPMPSGERIAINGQPTKETKSNAKSDPQSVNFVLESAQQQNKTLKTSDNNSKSEPIEQTK